MTKKLPFFYSSKLKLHITYNQTRHILIPILWLTSLQCRITGIPFMSNINFPRYMFSVFEEGDETKNVLQEQAKVAVINGSL